MLYKLPFSGSMDYRQDTFSNSNVDVVFQYQVPNDEFMFQTCLKLSERILCLSASFKGAW